MKKKIMIKGIKNIASTQGVKYLLCNKKKIPDKQVERVAADDLFCAITVTKAQA